MTNNLRALACALALSTAALGGATVLLCAPAQAAAVRPEIGTALTEAKNLAAAGNYKAAMAKINEAEAVSGKTSDESQIISQMKQYVGVKSGNASIGGAAAAKKKFGDDYAAKNYAEVIAAGDTLKKLGALDVSSEQVIAQAYYLKGDKTGCVKYIKATLGMNAGEDTLQLLNRCAYDANDDETQRQVLETLVSRTGKPDYWASLLKLSEQASGLSDHQTLDLYRIKLLTGNVTAKDEYTLLAQLAMQLGFPAEGAAVITKAQAAKLLTDDRSNKLLALAKTQAAADDANMAKNIASANAAPNGDALIKIGEDQVSMGKAKDAIATIQAGMKKPVTDKNNAAIRLGVAYLNAGQKADAVKTLDSVKGPAGDKAAMVAHLWSLYAAHAK